MAYNINFQALALWIGLAAVIAGGYFVVSSGSSSQQTSFNIGVEEDTVPGELTRLSVENNGEPVQGANISIDGEFIGTTNSQGIKGFETPDNNFTVEASKGDISSETTFTVEDGSFSAPDDSEDSDGDGEDEDSSDGSDSDGEDGDGSNDDSEDSDNQDSNQDSSDDDQQESSDTVDDFTGIELDEEPMIGELRTLTVYDTGEKVSGAEVTVNGEVVGTTNAGGTVTFGVPNAAEVSVSTDTGLSETFTVQDYTEDDQNQTDDQNDTEEDLTTGIQLDSDPVSGTNNRIILYDQGDRVSGETVYLGGNELGQTGSNGAIEFEVPLQEQITVSTDYDLQSETFNVTEDHPEPDITLLSPDDGSTFDTVQGETTDIDFEASVEITENSGTASVMIDGSEVYTQDLSQGENTISTTQALSGGSHSWSINVDTQEFDTTSSSRGFTVNEVEVEDGLSLQTTPPTAGEYNYVRLYDSGEPVTSQDITVDGQTYTTDDQGEVGFTVPNTQQLTVSSPNHEKTYSVDGYTESIDISASFTDTIYQERQNTLQVTGDGSSLEDATVYANDVEKGLTDSNGEISFQIPGESSITVFVEKDGSNFSQTFDTQQLELTVSSPESGELVQDYGDDPQNIDFTVDGDLTTDVSGTYSLVLNGNTKAETQVSSGSNTIDQQIQTTNEGSNNLQVNWDDGSTTHTLYDVSFESEWVENPFEFNLTNPDDGESINDYEATLKYFVYYDIDHNTRVYVQVDGETIDSTEFEGDTLGSNTNTPALSSGQHTWQLKLQDLEKNENMTSEQRTFTTEQDPPVALVNLDSPADGQTYSSDTSIQADYYTEVYEDSTHRVYVNGDTSLAPSKDLTQGDEGTYTFDIGTLDPGDYTISVAAESDSSGEEVFSEKKQIQVE